MAKKKKRILKQLDTEEEQPELPNTIPDVGDSNKDAMAPTKAEPKLAMFLSSLQRYFNADFLSDAVISCGEEEYKVHRLILAAHSKYFTKQLIGDWKESSERKILIDDFDTSVVEAMIRFMYTFNYSNVCSTSSAIFDAQIYQIADKYDIPALKNHAMSKFEAAIATGWSLDDFPLAVSLVYQSTPLEDRGLRDLVVATSSKHLEKLLGHAGFNETLRNTNDFAADLLPFTCKGTPQVQVANRTCGNCGYVTRM